MVHILNENFWYTHTCSLILTDCNDLIQNNSDDWSLDVFMCIITSSKECRPKSSKSGCFCVHINFIQSMTTEIIQILVVMYAYKNTDSQIWMNTILLTIIRERHIKHSKDREKVEWTIRNWVNFQGHLYPYLEVDYTQYCAKLPYQNGKFKYSISFQHAVVQHRTVVPHHTVVQY